MHFRSWLALALGLAAAAAAASAAAPVPSRLNHLEGTVAFAPAGEGEWTDSVPKRPLARGDRLWLDPGSRGELHLGMAAVRLTGPVRMAISAVDRRTVQLDVTQGSAQARLRALDTDQNFEINTPNLAMRAVQPGMYRVDVDRAKATTRVTVHAGSAVVYGQGGQAATVPAGRHVTFTGRALAQAASQPLTPDSFDHWSLARDRIETAALAQRQQAQPPSSAPVAAVAAVPPRPQVTARSPESAQPRRHAVPRREPSRPQARARTEVAASRAARAYPVTRQAQGHAYVMGGPNSAEHMAPADAQNHAHQGATQQKAQVGIPILRRY